ncbi:uncharacterized protein LOC120270541 [Dioscorea cayenensis subsp. rotundata]|uniref:Uncharacterized protein LOC120270541 n=1 Tax=Dioscorea cayennensis subsp. rotundata TaxID=55577 RepID=A0AB40C168_DIOCR|nr:uncharacterized protein LOC120270541 [Dioscorea cayenensis subsp. rotundata]
MRHGKEHHYSKGIDELCELLLKFIDFSPAKMPPVTPAGLVSLLLGCSLALMLCGFVTFIIGFILMPGALGMAMVLSLVEIGKAVLYPAISPKKMPNQTLLQITNNLTTILKKLLSNKSNLP